MLGALSRFAWRGSHRTKKNQPISGLNPLLVTNILRLTLNLLLLLCACNQINQINTSTNVHSSNRQNTFCRRLQPPPIPTTTTATHMSSRQALIGSPLRLPSTIDSPPSSLQGPSTSSTASLLLSTQSPSSPSRRLVSFQGPSCFCKEMSCHRMISSTLLSSGLPHKSRVGCRVMSVSPALSFLSLERSL